MTDEQIEKALECCNADKNICVECPYYYTNCNYVLTQDALDLIRRQKAQLVEQMLTVDAECEKCLHYRACLINSEYFPESPCCVFDRKSEWAKQTEGEWETGLQTCSYLSGTDAEYCCKCNVCGCFSVNAFAYCPECGAKMKGGDI